MEVATFTIITSLIMILLMLLMAGVHIYIIFLVIKLLKRTIALVEKKLWE